MYFKGIVMEINNDNVIVMKTNGSMIKIVNKNELSVGDAIYFIEEDIITSKAITKINKKRNWMIPLAAVAMLSIIFISPIINSKIGVKSYAMVSLDINPSASLQLDKNKNIISINGLNIDAQNLGLDKLVGMNLDEALKFINSNLIKEGYLNSNGDVLASLSFYDEINDSIYEESVKTSLSNGFNEANLVYIKSNKNSIKEAEKKGISIGRYQAYLELNDDVLEDTIEGMSIEELNKLLQEYTNSINLNEEILDEIKDELEDRTESESEIDEQESDNMEEKNTSNEPIYSNEEDDDDLYDDGDLEDEDHDDNDFNEENSEEED